ncbi:MULTISPECIES: hypothetical protein [Providencia]|uniref:hypothetical protein n=1 Tax=Providencia TaxID=586 RepID=UPI00197E71B1|nr:MULTISPECIES: hypothetical protein [Providencia]MBN4865207.1 hypothetical protein [Providencia stuartii]MBN4874567.1 hypothetical protein [Providencia stuartii]MBN4879220.1 hypothetical protein [Providencia stuartii]MBN4883768.1 hypothetical protein [Providencia stuartii]
MPNILHQQIKKYAKQRILAKAFKLLFVFLLTYGPAGLVGRVIKLLSSKWIINLLIKRLS